MFPDLTQHPEWLRGQTIEWCNRLAEQTGKYEYPWNAIIEGAAAEDIFCEELAKVVRGKALEVGCGHGVFANRWASQAEEVVGYDMTEGFLLTAEQNRKPNVRFVLGNTKEGLPFKDHEFDLIYTKKGPTSWYPEANRILKPGGHLCSLHPGDANGEGIELGSYFPRLFAPPQQGTPILDKINRLLSQSGLEAFSIRRLRETSYLPAVEDVLQIIGFGQTEGFIQYVKENCLERIRSQFDLHRSEQGLKTIGFYYLIQAQSASTPGPEGLAGV
ncbi:23S rRNA (guanine745-N1)-methyltransferase [Paenibacillus sp. 1_12]|uniref:class I SAM-dependent methyltransferase n=1 Tax=Paenibacillus sp. 1_12 TaxID=1566278 RepID=UPI0008F2AD75|nr:class I SAM-dependent methyltransferase [Paenibacillus sp. 1_12]SFL76686.1 23S rRNA (guanine745-N1)-methyltransferase [Paenibacillus sp. 1_12]